jgi:hypothetical protein
MTQLLATDGAAGDEFGYSVSISKDASTIVVGAANNDFSGSAYLFHITNMTSTSTTTTTNTMEWTQMGKFVAADRDTGDDLGNSIAIANNIVVVGADGDDSYQGSVYILDTGFLSTTMAPTGSPTTAAPTLKPTLTLAPNPTNPPSTMAPSNSNSPPLPMTNPPTTTAHVPPSVTTTQSPIVTDMDSTNSPSNKNSTPIQPPPTENPAVANSRTVVSTSAIVRVSASVVVGLVVIGIAIAFLNYRIKIKREAREQQQQAFNTGNDSILPPPSSTSNIPSAVPVDDEIATTIIADVVLMAPAQAAHDTTLEAVNAFLDPATAAAAPRRTTSKVQRPNENC